MSAKTRKAVKERFRELGRRLEIATVNKEGAELAIKDLQTKCPHSHMIEIEAFGLPSDYQCEDCGAVKHDR